MQLHLTAHTEFVICDYTIDETFRDLKHLLQLDHVMNKQQAQMEKVVTLVLLAFSIGYLAGEELRDVLYGPAPEATH